MAPDIFQPFTEQLPQFNLASIIGIGAVFIFFVIFAVIAGVVIYLVVKSLKFNNKIVIFERVSGRDVPTRKDRAMEMKMGDSGKTIFFCKKHKKYIPRPDLQTGPKTYWFYINSNGDWINFTVSDVRKGLDESNLKFSAIEVGYANQAIRKNLKERYSKPSFWSVYGGLVAYVSLIAITGIMVWLLFDKFIALAGTINTAIQSANEVLLAVKEVLVALDNIKSTSGIVGV